MINLKRTLACCLVAPLGAFAGWFVILVLAIPANLALRAWAQQGGVSDSGWNVFLFTVFIIGGLAAGVGFVKAGMKVYPEIPRKLLIGFLAILAAAVFIPTEDDITVLMKTAAYIALVAGGLLAVFAIRRRCSKKPLNAASNTASSTVFEEDQG